MRQSPNDKKSYKTITLNNGLCVLLVQNSESNQSAAALAINIGHFDDPLHRQGMAHFLEHMLFLGTQKYPEGSEYHAFISQHGGNHNAWTGTEHTCFFFDINSHFFETALDRFSQFFISPLLSKEFVDKERQNIDAEFKLKLKDDIRRLYDVHKETINPKHPFAKFSVGNSDTLSDKPGYNLRDEVHTFFQQHYCAELMTLVIEGPQDLDELTRLAQCFFNDIKSNPASAPKISEPLYLPEHQGLLIQVKPVKNDKQLILSFAMPSLEKYYRNKPDSVIAYLIGHEGKGSILSYLKNQQWALSLSAGSGVNGSNFKDFNISLTLTKIGESHINEIVSVVFSYISLIKQKPLAEHYFKEKKALSQFAFTYQEKQRPLDSVCHLVMNMQHYPAEDYMFGDYAMEHFEYDEINELLSYLTPSNLRVIHISQSNSYTHKSRWYEVPYSVQTIEKNIINKWHSSSGIATLYLPEENSYIIENPSILHQENISREKVPYLIEKNDGIAVWFKQDNTFNVPKGYIYISIDSPHTILSAKHIAMTRLFVDLYSDSVVESHYHAELAGIHYHLYAHQGGMTLQLSGISTKQAKLLKSLLSEFYQKTYQPHKFELFKEQLLKQWHNAASSKSISQLFAVLSATMQPNCPSSKTLAAALKDVSYEEFSQFNSQIFEQISVEGLIHGNWHKSDALNIVDTIKSAFRGHNSSKYEVNPPMIDIKNKGELVIPLTLEKHDHATVVYHPFADKSLKTSALAMLTSQILSPAFFQEMRTEKQYGYLVGVGFVPINRYPGLAFYIQSPHTKPQELQNAINSFIAESITLINQTTEKDWDNLQHGLVGQLKEKDASLRIKSQRFWSSINNKEIDFNQKKNLINIVNNLTIKDIRNFIMDLLVNKTSQDSMTLLASPLKENLPSHVQLNKQNFDLTKAHQLFPIKH